MEYPQAIRTWVVITLAFVLVFALGIKVAEAEVVVDSDGQPLKSGSAYKISAVTGGGVSARPRTQNQTCPLYVYYAKGGASVVFTPFSPNPLISESADLKVEMVGSSSACVQSTRSRWRLTTDSNTNKRFVYAGEAEASSGRDLAYFRIEKSEKVYEMEYCPGVCETCRPYCGRVGLYYEGGTGWLVVEANTPNPFKFQFKKA